MSKREQLRRLQALVLCMIAVCCVDGRAEPKSSEIEVWGWDVAAASLAALIPQYQEKFPGTKVEVVQSGANMQSRFLLSLVARVGAPDVSQLQMYEAPKFNSSGRMMDLSSLANKYKNDFPPASWTNCVHEDGVYAIPWDMGPCAVYYKRDLVEKYGVDYESIETWADFIEMGKEVVEKSGGKTKMLAVTVNGLFDYFEMFIQQTGGGIFDEEGRIIIHSPENVEALKVLRAILDSGITAQIAMWTHEYFASFQNDRVVTYPHAVWIGGSIKDYAPDTEGNWGVFRLPAMKRGGLRTSNIGGSVLAIPEQSENKEAAWQFVEYALCSKEGQLEQYRNFDLFPSLTTTFDDPFFDEPDPFYGGQKVRRLFATDIMKIPTLIRTNDWAETKRYVTQSLSQWATNHEDHDAFLARISKNLSRKLGRKESVLTSAKGN